jgi:hypothetical protein
VFSGQVVALSAIAALTVFAGGAATAGTQAAAGPAIGGVLPPGASVDLARSALFFDGARVAGPILVLVVWAVLGTALALALGGRIMDPVDIDAAAAAGAAV